MIADIKQAVCTEFGVRAIDMVSQRRARVVARPRQIAMYLCREMTPLSLPAIGRQFGGRDHTTVMHAISTIAGLIATDPEFADRLSRLREALIA